MNIGGSLLSPFIRSDAQGSVLAETFVNPEREFSIADIGRQTELLPAVAHREVVRLIESGVLLERRDGRSRKVQVNKGHPLYAPMAEIVEATYGLVPRLREALGKVPGIEEAYIYGSWAARRNGEAGLMPNDIDVLVIGNVRRSEIYAAASVVSDQVGREVNIHRTSREAWQNASSKSPSADPFLCTVVSRPLMRII